MSISSSNSSIQETPNIQDCEQLPTEVLQRIHGPAFLSRYMSITQPLDDDEEQTSNPSDSGYSRHRREAYRPPFYMSEDEVVLSDKPAWNIQWDSFSENHSNRRRRDVNSKSIKNSKVNKTVSTNSEHPPWQCETKIHWKYLGADFHPSYLQTIKCTQPTCFHNHYYCKEKRFAVRVLQRRHGLCEDAEKADLKKYGFTGKSAELWEFVEIPINFCCDCVVPKKNYFWL